MTDPADFYTGLVAEAYSALRSEEFDPARYAAFVRAHAAPALEVACGAGEPLLDLVADGLEVDGIDSSADMVDRARQEARRRGLRVSLHVGRMEDMSLGRRYGAIYLAGPSFELLPDDAVAVRALEAFRRHLAPGGTVMIPLWIAPPTPAEHLGSARESVDAAGDMLRYTPLSEVHDPSTRTRATTVRYERVPRTGAVQSIERTWVIHWQTLESITSAAARAGLAVQAVELPSGSAGSASGEEFTVHLTPA